ncbi:hypothetical protein M3Y94_00091400 [Aphelenchoides besseyi]|nr:hypothetical protein M3Y94_00091400 [Aphelenchoides besseyi]
MVDSFWLMNDWILAYDPLTKILYLHGSLSQVHNLLRELDADFMEYELSVKIGECLDHLFEQLDLLLCNSVAVDDEETLNETTAQLLDQIVKVLGSEQSRLMHTLWSAKLRSIELICLCNDTNGRWLVMDRDCVFEIFRFYLPANYNFRKYENKLMVEKSMERKGKKQNRGLSLSCTNKFQWLGYDQAFGQESDFGRVIQLTLEKLVEDIPYALKYRHWDEYQEHFLWILSNTTNLDGLKHLLLSAERIIRQPVFAPHWWNSFGALRLYRKAKDDDQSKSPIVSPSNEYAEIFYVRYRQHFPHVLPISRSFDESFRVCNREKMGGWLWKSSTYVTRYEKPPTVKLSDLNYSTPLAPNLPTGIRKNEAHFLFQQPICYSVECQLKPYEFIQTDRTLFFKCYNSQCPRRNYETNSNKWYCAWRNGKRPRAQSILPTRFIRSTVVGEGIAFPLPRPFEFKSRSTGRKSLFVLPQQALKRLARQGGLKSSFVLPGFKQTNQPVDSQLWPYPCSRPQYDHCWRYRTLKTQSLHSLALSLRILHASIRWNEFNPADPKMKWIHSVLNGHFQIVRFPKSHKELQPDGYSEMYKVELQTWQLTSPDGSRRQVTRILKEKQTVWIDGVDLKPFEIRRYWERYKMLEEKENEPVSKSTKRVFTSSTPEDDTPPKRSRK